MLSAPPFPYFGGKQSVADRIVALLPPARHYVEPFAGSLALLLAKPRSPMETVNDLDGDLVLFWRMLRDRPQDLARVCALTPHSRLEHQRCFEPADDLDELERARRVWVRLTQGRSGLTQRRTGWRHYANPHGGAGMPDYLGGYIARLLPAASRLAGVSLECRPALELIAKYGKHRDVLLYVDPPYLGSTRAWGNQYAHEMRSDDQHRELAEALRACRAHVVLSGYSSDLYDSLYDHWQSVRLSTFTGNGRRGDQNRTEVLWSNLPLTEAMSLFDEDTDVPALQHRDPSCAQTPTTPAAEAAATWDDTEVAS